MTNPGLHCNLCLYQGALFYTIVITLWKPLTDVIAFFMLPPHLIFIFKGCYIMNFISDVVTALITTSSLVNRWGSFLLFVTLQDALRNVMCSPSHLVRCFPEWDHWVKSMNIFMFFAPFWCAVKKGISVFQKPYISPIFTHSTSFCYFTDTVYILQL